MTILLIEFGIEPDQRCAIAKGAWRREIRSRDRIISFHRDCELTTYGYACILSRDVRVTYPAITIGRTPRSIREKTDSIVLIRPL